MPKFKTDYIYALNQSLQEEWNNFLALHSNARGLLWKTYDERCIGFLQARERMRKARRKR
jgi:hypothetical protein